jgi:hypothetical protein
VSKGNIIMSEMMEIAPGYASEFAEDFIRRKFLIVVGARNDGWRIVKYAPGAHEWLEACALLTEARDHGEVTEEHLERLREAWLALDSRVELGDGERKLLTEIFGSR